MTRMPRLRSLSAFFHGVGHGLVKTYVQTILVPHADGDGVTAEGFIHEELLVIANTESTEHTHLLRPSLLCRSGKGVGRYASPSPGVPNRVYSLN